MTYDFTKRVCIAVGLFAFSASAAFAQSLGGVTFQWVHIIPGTNSSSYDGVFVNSNPTCKKVQFNFIINGSPTFSQSVTMAGNSSSTYHYEHSGNSIQVIINSVTDC